MVEAKLRVVPLPPHKGLVAAHFNDLNESLEANIVALETGPASVELTDKLLIDLTGSSIEHAPVGTLQGDPRSATLC